MKRMLRAGLVLSLAVLLCAPAEAGLSSKEWSKLSKNVRKAAKYAQYSAMVGFIAEIGNDDSVRAVELLSWCSRVSDPDVYDAIREALSGMNNDGAVDAMCEQLSKGGSNWRFRVILADAFGRRTDQKTIGALNQSLEDRKDEVVRSALISMKRRRDKSSMEALVSKLEYLDKKRRTGLIRNTVVDLLTSMSGEEFESAEDWRGWWDARKDQFEVLSREASGRKRKRVEGTELRKKPKFFGSEINSRRIVFVIDVSGSMRASDPARPKTPGSGREATGGDKDKEKPDPVAPSRVRLERAKFQLALAINALPKDAAFSIIAYHGAAGAVPPRGAKIMPQVLGKKISWLSVWSPKLVPARSKAAVKKAATWVGELKPLGGTFTFNGLRAAFEIKDVDNIILLSDGAPNDPVLPQPGAANPQPRPGQPVPGGLGAYMSPDDILKEIQGLNKFRKIRIDTFGFDSQPAGLRGRTINGGQNPFVEFLKKVAGQNGGKFTPIN